MGRPDLQGFIRDTLGCGCPDAVLRRIEPLVEPDSLAGVPVLLALDVGGRLLVALVEDSALADDAGALHDALEAGRRLRDVRGMNRFRLVVVSDAVEGVESRRRSLATRARFHDERVHLHVIGPRDLPEIDMNE
jgi:hypothetical protein